MKGDAKEILVGDKVQVEVNEDRQVNTRIEMVRDNNIWVADFMADIWDIPWRRRAFDVRFIRRNECYTFLAEIQGRERIDHLLFTRLLKVSHVEEVQRRASYRLMESFEIYVRPVEEDEGFIKCRGIDISETGVGLNTKKNFGQDDEVECRFELGGVQYNFLAAVKRKAVWLREDAYEYRLGLQFHPADDARTEKLLKELRRFIFKRQVARKL